MSGSINRVYKVKVEDGKKMPLGVDGDIFIDKENAAIKLKGDLLTVLARKDWAVEELNKKFDKASLTYSDGGKHDHVEVTKLEVIHDTKAGNFPYSMKVWYVDATSGKENFQQIDIGNVLQSYVDEKNKVQDDRLTALENRPAGGAETMTIYGSPLILSEGEISLNYYKNNGETDTLDVFIDSSNWDDTVPVSQLFLLRNTDVPDSTSDEKKVFNIVSAVMTAPRQTVTVCGTLVYRLVNEKYEWHMDIYCVGKVEAK